MKKKEEHREERSKYLQREKKSDVRLGMKKKEARSSRVESGLWTAQL